MIDRKTVFWLLITIAVIILTINFGLSFVIGMLIGWVTMAVIFMFPHPIMIAMLQRLFGIDIYHNQVQEMVINESDEKVQEREKHRVRYQK